MVVFEDGLARKSEYRRFIVRGATDDVSAMSEVLRRRFARYLDARAETGELGEETAGDPDRPRHRPDHRPAAQVRVPAAAGRGRRRRAAGQRGRGGPAPSWASTTSRCAGWPSGWRRSGCPTTTFPVILPRTSEGLYLLQRVRDEAHRFAITFHRQRRSKRMTASALDNVPGLGEVRRKALLRHFGSLKRLAAASVEEIAEVPGIGRRTAEAILAALDEGTKTPQS